MSGTKNFGGVTYVIPCGGAKADHPAQARDLYTGQMFTHTLTAALAQAGPGDRVLILSALHGLVELDQLVAPYDVKMGGPGSVTPAEVAAQALTLGIDWGSEVYAFLPAGYFRVLDTALRALDVYTQDVYEAAPGIGYQRGVNRCVTQH